MNPILINNLLWVMQGFLAVTFLIAGSAKLFQSPAKAIDREMKNLTTFANVYGHIKYFHPSDETRLVHWDKLAILGAERVLQAQNDEELVKILNTLFSPIAPTLQVQMSQPDPDTFLPDYLNTIDTDTSSLQKVGWQHLGVNLSFSQRGPYTSIRTNREDTPADSNFYLFQSFDAGDLIDSTMRLAAMIMTDLENYDGFAELIISSYDNSNAVIAKDTYTVHAYTGDEWQEYQLEAAIPEGTAMVSAGVRLNGEGNIRIDDVRFLTITPDEGKSLMVNGDFEEERFGRPIGWRSTLSGNYDFGIDTVHSATGPNSFYMAGTEPQLPDRLFDELPEVGETVVKEVGDDIWMRMPLTLYSEHSTLPAADEEKLNILREQLHNIELERVSGNDKFVRLANIIIAWNELQHFFPYFDIIETDWNRQLLESLKRAYEDRSAEDFYYTLWEMVAALQDGHGRVLFPPMDSKVGFPFITDWVEDNVVVTHSEHDQIKPGDIIRLVNDVPAAHIVQSKQQILSGSPQYTLFQALRQFAVGDEGAEAEIVIDRDGDIQTVHIPRTASVNYSQMEKSKRDMIGFIDEDIMYVDLDIAPIDTILSRMDDIAASEAVIFDLRGYPSGNHNVISHLLSDPDTSSSWMQVPQIIYPDQQNIVGYRKAGWNLPVSEPKIEGNVVFITDGRAISYAESFMGFIEHYQLAEIVGQPTAGANGNVNHFSLPGSYQITWTGMKVLKHDGSQLYLNGIQPTVQAKKTLKGVRQELDEFLEKAIEVARNN